MKSTTARLRFSAVLLIIMASVAFTALAQTGDPVVTSHPTSATVPLNTNVTFTCAGYRYITWQVNDLQLASIRAQNKLNSIGIYGPIDNQNFSQLFVHATEENNNTRISCILRTDPYEITNEESQTAYLYVYASPSPPSDLTITQSGLDLHLSWEAPFSLEGENITYIVRATNTRTGVTTDWRTDTPQLVFGGFLEDHDCSAYEFSVYSVNLYGQSHESVNTTHRLPTRPFGLQVTDISIEVSHMNGLSITLQFNNPSPCSSYRVTSYNLIFEDRIESSGSFSTNILSSNDFEDVSLVIDYQNTPLQMGRHYWVTVEAVNIAGSTLSEPVEIYTTGLQSSTVELVGTDTPTASVTCNFALGSDALGCEVSFYTSSMSDSMELLFAQNITREPSSDTVVELISLLGSFEGRDILVEVAELQADGSVHTIVVTSQVFQNTVSTAAKYLTDEDTNEELMFSDVSEATDATLSDLEEGVFPFTWVITGIVLAITLIVLLLIISVIVVIWVTTRRKIVSPTDIEKPCPDGLIVNPSYGVACHKAGKKGSKKSTIFYIGQATSATTPQEILSPVDLLSGGDMVVGGVKTNPVPYEEFVPASVQNGPVHKASTSVPKATIRNPLYAEAVTELEVKCHKYEEIKPKQGVKASTSVTQEPVVYDELKFDPDGVNNLRVNPCYGVTKSRTHQQ